MLTLPSPPTDNLYKFMSVAGIVLFVVGLTLPWILDQREIEWYWQSVESIGPRNMERLMTMANYVQRAEVSLDEKKMEMAEVLEAVEVNRAKELINLNQKVAERSAMREWRVRALGITKWGGLALAGVGFWLWWWRVQRLQDHLLQLQCTKAAQELKK